MKPPHSAGAYLSSASSLPLVGPHPFADMNYFQSVIDCLTTTRKEQQLEVRDVARRAKVKEATIRRAERDGAIPRSDEFRAWSMALGMTWEQVWTISLPR
ncbi:MAG: XRE family transcriptional regulator [Verrucomicrobiaceae bacterium]|nr:MAG: XRE family transcriptional regulator [Verrucomicrobiaceae bacterium]